MTLLSASFPFLPDVPLMEHIEIHLAECSAGDRQWIERVTAAARPHCRGRVYLNALAYVAAKTWFQDMGISVQPTHPVDELELPCFWEFVNGTALDTPMGRVVLLPEEVLDLEEWLVPREWLDIPAWRPDYFVGVQVLTDEEPVQIKLWGYASAPEVARETYDPLLHTYAIDRQQMVEDVALLLLLPERQPQSIPLPEPALVSAEVIEKIAQAEIPLPRLVLSLDEWFQIIGQPQHRISLFLACHPRRLGLWLRGREYAISQSLQSVWQELTAALTPNAYLGWGSLRGTDLPKEGNDASLATDTRKAIASQQLLRQVQANRDAANPELLTSLKALIADPPSEDIRWQAAELLHDLNTADPTAGSWKVRQVDLGVELQGIPLALTMAVLPRDARTAHLFVRVTPFTGDTFLPEGLSLRIMTEAGDCFASLTSRTEDQVVQYKFWGDSGEAFGVIVEYGSARITESFVV